MRPCKHTEHKVGCRICFWCKDPSPQGKAYRTLWGEPEPETTEVPTPKGQTKGPGIIQKAMNFAGAVVRHVANGMKEVSEEVRQNRLSLCMAPCERYNAAKKSCGSCGCGVGSRVLDKTKWASERCPLGKWEREE